MSPTMRGGSVPDPTAWPPQFAWRRRVSVLVAEANDTIGGGARSAEATLPGFMHNLASAVHPMAAGSLSRTLPLEKYGLTGSAGRPWPTPWTTVRRQSSGRSVRATAAGLGQDQAAYERLMEPLAANWEALAREYVAAVASLAAASAAAGPLWPARRRLRNGPGPELVCG